MDTKKYIKEAHENAVKHGFWEGTQDQDRVLLLIISEIGEIVEADRKNRHVNFTDIDKYLAGTEDDVFFQAFIKDTFEDEVADTFIRIFDLCGQYGIKLDGLEFDAQVTSVYPALRTICRYIANGQIIPAFRCLIGFADYTVDGDIEQCIKAKMQYNKNRPYKHGKEY